MLCERRPRPRPAGRGGVQGAGAGDAGGGGEGDAGGVAAEGAPDAGVGGHGAPVAESHPGLEEGRVALALRLGHLREEAAQDVQALGIPHATHGEAGGVERLLPVERGEHELAAVGRGGTPPAPLHLHQASIDRLEGGRRLGLAGIIRDDEGEHARLRMRACRLAGQLLCKLQRYFLARGVRLQERLEGRPPHGLGAHEGAGWVKVCDRPPG